MQNEESLVRRARQRDESAFSELYEAYFDKIYRYITFKIGDKMEAEDMTQQVFLNALKSISSFELRGAPFSAWLYRIAHNQVVDYFRKKTKRINVPLEEAANVASHDDPQETTEQNFDIEQLLLATKKLTALQGEVISLRFAGELSTREVARIMGKSENAVKALQHSAIAALRRSLMGKEDEAR